jgi:uncharacterized membrane protein
VVITNSGRVAIASDQFFAESYFTLAMPTTAETLLMFLPGFAWGVWLPYLSATIILVIGLTTLTKDFAHRQGLNKFVALGPLFIAMPIAIFGTEHFTATKIIAGMVPGWIPGHMFWALFVGTCLVAAALSIAARKYVWLAAALLGFMICLFVLLIHIPNIAGAPHNRLLWVVALRDLAFAGGAFSVSAAQIGGWTPVGRNRLVTLARLSLAIAITVCGVEQFLYPKLLSGIPLERSTPVWIPARLLWSYLAGVVFIVAGISMLINKRVRLAATAAGLMTLFLVVVVYVPLLVSKPSDIGEGLNYLADTLLLCGSLLAFAETQPDSLAFDHQSSESEAPSVQARAGQVS